ACGSFAPLRKRCGATPRASVSFAAADQRSGSSVGEILVGALTRRQATTFEWTAPTPVSIAPILWSTIVSALHRVEKYRPRHPDGGRTRCAQRAALRTGSLAAPSSPALAPQSPRARSCWGLAKLTLLCWSSLP